jgi:predicted HicB family RNase H-like nuclease
MDYLKYKGYIGSVEYSEADNCLCGKVLGMSKDSITYEGNSIDELRKDFQTGIESYLEGCKEIGIVPRKGFNGVLSIRIPSEIHCRLATIAEKNNTTINAVVRNSIERQLQTELT